MLPLDRIRHATQAARPAWRRIRTAQPERGSQGVTPIAADRLDTTDRHAPRHADWDAYYASEQQEEAL